jgi:cell division transport system permease protein
MLQIWRVIHAGIRNFMRNMWLTTAATAVMTITLTIVISSFISNSALTNTVKNYTDKIDVSFYLRDDVTTDQLAALKAKISANPNTASLHYVSKADALADFRKAHANDKNLLAATQSDAENPLPASIQIGAKDPKKLDSFSAIATTPDVAALLDAKKPLSYTGDKKAQIDKIIGFSIYHECRPHL